MKAAERRKAIVNLLLSSNEAVSGSTLSEKFGVSRQIIVQDITVLKGSGYEILSTHNGYIMQQTPLKERVFKLHHTTEETEDELNLIVDLGGTVVDVFVWHNKIADSRRSLGLGLALCKSIIHAHGGEITLTDNLPHGSIFTFTIPSGEVNINE